MDTDEIRRFTEALKSTEKLWRSIDLRVIAANVAGRWCNLVSRAYCDFRPPSRVTRFEHLPVGRLVGAWQVVLPYSFLSEFLQSAEGGAVEAPGIPRIFLANGIPDAQPTDHLPRATYFYNDLSGVGQPLYAHWSGHVLQLAGEGVDAVLRASSPEYWAHDTEVRAHRHPWDGLDGLVRFFAASPKPFQGNRMSTLELVAPLSARFVREQCSLKAGTLRVVVETESIGPARSVTLGAFGVGDEPLPMSTTLGNPKMSRVGNGPAYRLEWSASAPGVASASLFLSVGGNVVHRHHVVDPSSGGVNPRISAYSAVDEDLTTYFQWLAGEGKDRGRDFERALARLFTFCGFQVDLLASPGALSDAVDLFAYDPHSPRMFAVETTVDTLDRNDHIAKLKARVASLRRAVPGMEITGVLATPLSSGDLDEASVERCLDEGLVVLASEDCDGLLLRARSGESTPDLVDVIRAGVSPDARWRTAQRARSRSAVSPFLR